MKFIACASALFLLFSAQSVIAGGSVVTIKQSPDGQFTLLRDGQPYFIKGAGGHTHLDVLRDIGGNSIRTWSADALEEKVDGKPLLDRAQELGLSVAVGLWLKHQRHGFDYSNEKTVADQRDEIRAAIKKYKDHPAVLVWGVGNEMEGPASDGSDARVWKEVNVLAGIVKEEDTNHPVMTVIAGAGDTKVKGVVTYCTNVDILGVNAYGSATGAGAAVKKCGWKKTFILTEFGLPGFWEARKTGWGAPIEPSSQQKAASYYATQSRVAEENAATCLGTYAFVWGQKQECTATWFGMFLETGEKLPQVDALAYAWNKKWPDNRCPKIVRFESKLKETTVKPGETFDASVEATDPNGDSLTYEWSVIAESTAHSEGGDAEAKPDAFPETIIEQGHSEARIRVPEKTGGYRLFITVRDGKGAASCDNIPFRVGQY